MTIQGQGQGQSLREPVQMSFLLQEQPNGKANDETEAAARNVYNVHAEVKAALALKGNRDLHYAGGGRVDGVEAMPRSRVGRWYWQWYALWTIVDHLADILTGVSKWWVLTILSSGLHPVVVID
ncbi:hypothetical protein FS749_007580 [Ceratobasidium sp. UAMH 11750]|nr:hypothetical protein FS749_007580 [Ceratobasidium sp. UAMH 11750]